MELRTAGYELTMLLKKVIIITSMFMFLKAHKKLILLIWKEPFYYRK